MRTTKHPPRRLFACGLWAVAALAAMPLAGQTQPELQQILQRLERLEQQNRELLDEVRELKNELASAPGRAAESAPAPSQASTEERLDVQESRTAEMAQSKVEASHGFPIRLTGMALFNTSLNSRGTSLYPTVAQPGIDGSANGTLRQSIIGLDYRGPLAPGGGQISGTLRLDLFGGSGQVLDQLVRLRTATLNIDWKTRGFMAGIDKPLISPREPESLAQVGVSPLTGAGNLWLWIPQVRYQQDVSLGEQAGLRAQVGVVQTHEVGASALSSYVPATQSGYYEPARPGLEARLLFFDGNTRRVEAAGSIHRSVSHVLGISVPSNVYSVDWLAKPWHFLEFTGTAFTGQNLTPLGTGGIRQGFIALNSGGVVPVHSRGGWGQVTLRPSPRFWMNLFSGQQDDRNTDLPAGGIGKNLAIGANLFYRLAPNVLASFEVSQTRTVYIGSGTLLNNHYDLAFAYLF